MSEAPAITLPLVVTCSSTMRVEVGVEVGVSMAEDGTLNLDEAGLAHSIAEGLLLVAAMVLDGQPDQLALALGDTVGDALDAFDVILSDH